MYMKKVTTLLASLAFGWCCIAGPAAAATVAGVEFADHDYPPVGRRKMAPSAGDGQP